jgi:hypothetical protein
MILNTDRTFETLEWWIDSGQLVRRHRLTFIALIPPARTDGAWPCAYLSEYLVFNLREVATIES